MATATTPAPTEAAAERAGLRSVNPYNGQVLKTFTEMSPRRSSDAIAKAHERFASWRRVPFAERGALLRARPRCAASAGKSWRGSWRWRWASTSSRAARRSISAPGSSTTMRSNGERFLQPQIDPVAAGRRDAAEPAPRRDPRHRALELPLLPGRPLRGAEPDGGEHHRPEARLQRPAMCRGRRGAVPRRGLPAGRLHEPRHLFPPHPGGSSTTIGCKGCRSRGATRAAPGSRSAPARTSRRRSWSWAAAIRSSCSRTPTWS